MGIDTVMYFILVIIGIVILFQTVAALFPTLTSAGSTLNASGFPLASLFVSGGAGWYILAAAVIYFVFKKLSQAR